MVFCQLLLLLPGAISTSSANILSQPGKAIFLYICTYTGIPLFLSSPVPDQLLQSKQPFKGIVFDCFSLTLFRVVFSVLSCWGWGGHGL